MVSEPKLNFFFHVATTTQLKSLSPLLYYLSLFIGPNLLPLLGQPCRPYLAKLAALIGLLLPLILGRHYSPFCTVSLVLLVPSPPPFLGHHYCPLTDYSKYVVFLGLMASYGSDELLPISVPLTGLIAPLAPSLVSTTLSHVSSLVEAFSWHDIPSQANWHDRNTPLTI